MSYISLLSEKDDIRAVFPPEGVNNRITPSTGITFLSSFQNYMRYVNAGGQQVDSATVADYFKGVVYDCIKLYQDAISTATMRLRDANNNVVKSHGLLDALYSVNDVGMTGDSRMRLLVAYILLFGSGMFYIENDSYDRKVQTFYVLRPDMFKDIIYDKNGRISYYVLYGVGQNGRLIEQNIEANRILHFKEPNPFDFKWGYPRILTAANSIDQLTLMNANRMAILKTGMPPYAFKSSEPLTPSQTEELQQQMKEKHSGWDSSGNFLTGDAPFLPYGLEPIGFPVEFDNLMFENNIKNMEKTICKAFGVSEALRGEGVDFNKDTVNAEIRFFLSYRIKPFLKIIASVLNYTLMPRLRGMRGWKIEPYIEVIEEDFERAKIINTHVVSGIMTRDEARELLDLPQLEYEDEIYLPLQIQRVEKKSGEGIPLAKEVEDAADNNAVNNDDSNSEKEMVGYFKKKVMKYIRNNIAAINAHEPNALGDIIAMLEEDTRDIFSENSLSNVFKSELIHAIGEGCELPLDKLNDKIAKMFDDYLTLCGGLESV